MQLRCFRGSYSPAKNADAGVAPSRRFHLRILPAPVSRRRLKCSEISSCSWYASRARSVAIKKATSTAKSAPLPPASNARIHSPAHGSRPSAPPSSGRPAAASRCWSASAHCPIPRGTGSAVRPSAPAGRHRPGLPHRQTGNGCFRDGPSHKPRTNLAIGPVLAKPITPRKPRESRISRGPQ